LNESVEVTKRSKKSPGRDRLIRTALELFSSLGFDKVSTRDIARNADVSLQLIWHHFGTKEGLRDAVDHQVEQELLELSKNLAEGFPDVRERFNELGRRVAIFSKRDNGNSHRYFRRMLLDDNDRGKTAYKVLVSCTLQMLDGIPAKIRIGEKEVNRESLYIFMISLLSGPILLKPFLDKELAEDIYASEKYQNRIDLYSGLLMLFNNNAK